MSSLILSAFKDVANTALNAGAGLGHGITNGAGAQCPLKMIGKQNTQLGSNSYHQLDFASKACPVASECRDFGEGIAQGDFNQAAAGAGMLAMYSLTA